MGPTLIEEWSNLSIKNPVLRYGLRMIFSYAIRQGEKLIRICRDEYDYNLKDMIEDAREGRLEVAPTTIRFIYDLISNL